MRIDDFSPEDRKSLLPLPGGDLAYRCLGCGAWHSIESLLYTCPECGAVLLIEDRNWDELKKTPGQAWRRIFDLRRMVNQPALKGVFRYAELLAPVVPADSVVYLGEGHTPLVEATGLLRDLIGARFFFKNDGQNPSASFKDRGMAVALSYLNYLIKHKNIGPVLSICASTGDTSAAAALYASYLAPVVKSAVLLPRGKVTPQQLSQPLGSGATVYELPGVFDDCMKVVEHLADNYQVALMNSQERPGASWARKSYAYEGCPGSGLRPGRRLRGVCAHRQRRATSRALMSGFMKLFDLGIITGLPKLVGVQSHHADPVFKYYQETDPAKRKYAPVQVQASVAQAAMIGNPVSMPRVMELARRYDQAAGRPAFFVVQVTEQEIMDNMITANRFGHVVCTQGGESLAGLVRARAKGIVSDEEYAILDATAHHLKFIGFQQMYFEDGFPPEFGVTPRPELVNRPEVVLAPGLSRLPEPGAPLSGEDFEKFVTATAGEIARRLELEKK